MKNNIICNVCYVLILVFIVGSSCSEPAPQIPANKLPDESIDKNMMILNREFAELGENEINCYIDSLQLNLSRSDIGLRYRIVKEGTGQAIEKGDEVTVNYSIRMLNGPECEKLTNVTKKIRLGKNDVEKGIEEAVLLLKVSGEGEFIIPSHLAFGVAGYKNCIAPWAPVFCTLHIISKPN